jgi:type II secretory pathway component PulF
MSRFRFEAARADGATVRGVIDAGTAGEAAAVLSGRGLFPVRVEAAPSEAGWARRPPGHARATVLQSLASLVEAGVSIERALEATVPLAGGPLRDAVRRVADRVREGASLGAALGAEPAFGRVTVGLVRAGERGAGLGAALAQAAHQLEREAETAARIRAALAYPMILLAVGAASLIVIVSVVIPRFAQLLDDVEGALPPATRLLLALSAALRAGGPWVVAGALVAATLGGYAISRCGERWHRHLLGVPLIGPIRHALATARVCRALASLLGTGVSALPALEVAGEAAGDRAVGERLGRVRDRVAEGAALSAGLAATGAVTPLAQQLAAIGEGSGRLPALLAKAAELEEQSAERRLRTLVGLLEPALILLFAALVAFVAVALLQGIYSVRPT